MPTPEQWKLWRQKRAWYERNSSRARSRRLDRHAAESGFFVRRPHEGEMLDGLDQGRVSVGEGTLFEPGCWVTLGPEAELRIGEGCFLNRNVMVAVVEKVEIGDHTMFANGCFVGDGEHRYDDPNVPITWQGFKPRGPISIGSNCWFGVNCVVTGGVTVGDRAVIGANSVVTEDVPAGTIAVGAPAKVLRKIDFKT